MTLSHAVPMSDVLVLPTGMTELNGDQMVKINGGLISLGCAVFALGVFGLALIAVGAAVYLLSR